MKLEPVTKLDKRNKTMSKTFDDDVMSRNCDVIAIFSIYSRFGAIWKLDSGCTVCKIYLQKLKTELKNLWHSSHTIVLSKGTIFAKERCFSPPKKC